MTAVVLFHAGVAGFGGGFVGVDVFFVISGFLIARLICGQIRDGKFSLVDFWERRVRRIFPALFVMTAVSAAIAWRVLLPVDFVSFGHSLVAQSIFSQNLLFWSESGYFAAPASGKPLLHTWTLAVEEQFYLAFPLVVLAVNRFAKQLLAWVILTLLCASFALSVWSTKTHPSVAFYWLPMRAWELLIGAALNFVPPLSAFFPPRALRAMRELGATAGLALIAFSVVTYNANTHFPGVAALAPCLGAALLIGTGGASQTVVARALSAPPLVFIGLISYSLYLWHMPVMVFWRSVLVRQLTPTESVIAIAISTLAAWLSYKFVETPVRRRSVLISRRRLFASSFVGAAFIVTIGLATHLTHGFPDRFRSVDRYLAETYAPEHTAAECPASHPERSFEDRTCLIGHADASKRPVFLLWGDSHADAIKPAFDALADKAQLAGYFSWASGCPPLAGVHHAPMPADPVPNPCQVNADATLNFVRKSGIKSVVLAARWAMYVEGRNRRGVEHDEVDLFLSDDQIESNSSASSKKVFSRHLEGTVDALLGMGIEVWIVEDVPEYEFVVPKKLISVARSHGDLAGVGLPLSEYRAREAFVSSAFHDLGNRVHLLDPGALLCQPRDFCRTNESGWSIYRDDDHLSRHGAAYVEPAFDELFTQLVKNPADH